MNSTQAVKSASDRRTGNLRDQAVDAIIVTATSDDALAIVDGRAAARAGHGPALCPHPSGSRAAAFWLAGLRS